MIDMGLFLLGALGALLTIYMAKHEIIPEFRPLFDTSEKENEVSEHQEHIKNTEKHIDDIQNKLEEEKPLTEDSVTRLTIVINTSQDELRDERKRLQVLEREIKQNQIISRSVGFLIYIILGGVFGSLLADKVQVDGLNEDLPNFFKSMLIGATWTSYLSTIGFSSGPKKADEIIEAGLKGFAEKFVALKKEIMNIIAQEAAKAENVVKTEKVEQPYNADEVSRIITDKIDLAGIDLQKDMNLTRQMVRREMKRIL